MVIVVPALTHRDEGGEPNVAPLHGGASNFANHSAVVVREVADQPMPENAGGDACAHTPKHKSPAAPCIEKNGPRQLLRHPGPLQKTIEFVPRNSRFDTDARRRLEHQIAVQLPPSITPGRTPVAKVLVTLR